MKLTVFSRYAVEFTLCSFFGWLYEVLLDLILYHNYTDRGILHLPVCPIYGFAGLALLLLLRRHRGWLTVFAVSVLLPTVLELVTFAPLQKLTGCILWDYSAWWCNYKGIVSVPSSLLFGVMGLLLVKCLHPLMDLVQNRMPQTWLCAAGSVCTVLLLTDASVTFFYE